MNYICELLDVDLPSKSQKYMTVGVGRNLRVSYEVWPAYSRVYTVKCGKSPRMKTAYPLWTSCATIWMSSWWKKFSLCPVSTCPVFIYTHCLWTLCLILVWIVQLCQLSDLVSTGGCYQTPESIAALVWTCSKPPAALAKGKCLSHHHHSGCHWTLFSLLMSFLHRGSQLG